MCYIVKGLNFYIKGTLRVFKTYFTFLTGIGIYSVMLRSGLSAMAAVLIVLAVEMH